MKAVESAPSANKSRSKFGRRNAIKNASRFLPAPNRPANTISRIKPSTRLHRIAMPTIPVARVLTRRSSAAAIGEQRTASPRFTKEKTSRATYPTPRMTRMTPILQGVFVKRRFQTGRRLIQSSERGPGRLDRQGRRRTAPSELGSERIKRLYNKIAFGVAARVLTRNLKTSAAENSRLYNIMRFDSRAFVPRRFL